MPGIFSGGAYMESTAPASHGISSFRSVKLFPCVSQSADHDPFMPDSDREGLNTVRAQRADDLVEVRSISYDWSVAFLPMRSLQRCFTLSPPVQSR